LESLGIGKCDKSVHAKFKENISHKDGRYEVSLSWKEFHDPLPDTYILSLKRLQGLIRRLRQMPMLLEEYNAIIQDQGIVEMVSPSDSFPCTQLHYLPHYAVIR